MNKRQMGDMDKAHYYFKLKHNIQNDSELELAKLEIEHLMNKKAEDIINFVDVISCQPLKDFVAEKGVRSQDYITRSIYPGAIQGFYIKNTIMDCLKLITRPTFFREFFVLVESAKSDLLKQLVPNISSNHIEFSDEVRSYESNLPYAQLFTVQKNDPKMLLRLIPLHTLYEPSDFICRLAWKAEHVDRMFEQSMDHIKKQIYRPHSPSSARWFKKIGDFIDSREAPQLYLTHYIFGIHGKFFPRMIGAIMNALDVGKGEWVLDPFCGVGTMNVEASLRGINNIGIDMQPLFTIITDLKIKSMYWDFSLMKKYVDKLLNEIQMNLEAENPATMSKYIVEKKSDEVYLPNLLMKGVSEDSLKFIKVIKGCINEIGSEIKDKKLRSEFENFCKLPMAYWMRSMLKKQIPPKIFETYKEYLLQTFFSVYYFNRFKNEIYNFELGESRAYNHDIRKMNQIDDDVLRKGVDGIITSPPYGTAIDYVGEHVWALYVLGLTKDHRELDQEKHIGSPRVSKAAVNEIHEKSEDFVSLPKIAQETLFKLATNGKEQKAAAFYKYYVGMRDAFEQMSNVLKKDKKLVMIIGKQQGVSIDGTSVTVELGRIMEEIGKTKKLEHLSSIDIGLQKASERGAIPTEHIIFFKKI